MKNSINYRTAWQILFLVTGSLAAGVFLWAYGKTLSDPAFLPGVIQIGGLNLHLYGVALITGLLTVLWLLNRSWQLYLAEPGLPELNVERLALWVIIPAVIGARIYHLFTDWHLYAADPVSALYFWRGGLGIYGALIGGALGLFIYTRRAGLPFTKLLDLAAIALPLGQAIGRFGNLFNRELYGAPTDLPWGMSVPGMPGKYQPAFLYEQIGDVLLFVLLYLAFKRKLIKAGQGRIMAWYLLGYAIIRFNVDWVRLEPHTAFGTFTTAQMVSLVIIVLGVMFLVLKNNKLSSIINSWNNKK